MRFEPTAFALKDGRSCILRSPTPADSEAIIAYLRQVNGETEYLTRYPDEVRMTAEREAVLLRCYQGMTVNETAQALRISPTAVSKRLKKAFDRLRSLGEGGGEND